MDQNVVRTDLLPESFSAGLLVALAVLGVAAWVACHWLIRTRCANRFNVWVRALLSVPAGTVASWLVFQALARAMFFSTTWSLFFAAVLAAVSFEAVTAFYAHERVRIPARTGRILVACRLGAVAIALVVLLQPVVVGERQRTVDQRVVVLVDDSASMQFKDRQLTDAERADLASALGLRSLPAAGMTRAEMIRALVKAGDGKGPLDRLRAKYTVDVFRFGNGLVRCEDLGEERPLDAKEQMFRSTTDLTKALEFVLREVPPEEITSVIVFTDGRHNGDAGVESIARRFGSYGISVSSVVVGGTVKPFDLAIASASSPESVFLGDKVRFTVRVSATRANGRRSTLRLYREQGEGDRIEKVKLDERAFSVEGDDWSREFRFADIPKEQGVYRYHLVVEGVSGEFTDENNSRSLDVAVSDDRTNVLLVDARPRWEYRYLRNLFYGRDKSVHLQDWLVHPDRIAGEEPRELPRASAARPFGESEAGGFPETPDAWRLFDVIILGDLGEDVLTPDVVESIRSCVEERGALLVLIGGPEAMPYAIRNETLRDLIPVVYDPDSASHREAPEEAFRLMLTSAGRGHAVMSQSSSSAENEEIWQEISDFRWRLPLKDVKPGAEVLAYAQPRQGDDAGRLTAVAESIAASIEEDPESALARLEQMRGEQNRNALITSVTRGKGRVLMLTTDSMWRLRSKSGDEIHHRFWGQVMRWGAGERMRAGNAHVRLGTDLLRYGAGEPVKAYCRVLDGKFNGLDGLSPRFVVRAPGQTKGRTCYPRLRPDSNGFYECEIPGCTEPGTYSITLECGEANDLLGDLYPVGLTTSFVVVTTKQPAEEVELTATRDFVERIARTTDGRVWSPSEFVKLDGDFGGGSKKVADRIEYQLWSAPPLFILIVLLLTVEWIFRKRASLA